jgi:hypothetical protein
MASPLRRIPVSQPCITSSDKAAVLDCLDKTYLSGDSPIVGEFEENFAQAIDAEYGIAVANGSVALDLVMHALDLSEGDEVIVPSFTIASCLFSILRTGATPIFVDAIKNMSFTDAKNILMGNESAATSYLQTNTTSQLYAKFNPVIKNSFTKVGADKVWATIIKKYNSLPMVKKVNPDLTDYTTNKALEGVFKMIGVEEKNIRADIKARTTPLLQQVFAMQDKK